jgi:hypothetical protein
MIETIASGPTGQRKPTTRSAGKAGSGFGAEIGAAA